MILCVVEGIIMGAKHGISCSENYFIVILYPKS